jgi:hypothetical protein
MSQAMCPGELSTIVHELLVGQASERVRKLGVDVGDVMVNVAPSLFGTFFVMNGSPGSHWIFLVVGAFSRHGGAEGEKL